MHLNKESKVRDSVSRSRLLLDMALGLLWTIHGSFKNRILGIPWSPSRPSFAIEGWPDKPRPEYSYPQRSATGPTQFTYTSSTHTETRANVMTHCGSDDGARSTSLPSGTRRGGGSCQILEAKLHSITETLVSRLPKQPLITLSLRQFHAYATSLCVGAPLPVILIITPRMWDETIDHQA